MKYKFLLYRYLLHLFLEKVFRTKFELFLKVLVPAIS